MSIEGRRKQEKVCKGEKEGKEKEEKEDRKGGAKREVLKGKGGAYKLFSPVLSPLS